MSFSKAKLNRFNDIKCEAPPPGYYNPNYEPGRRSSMTYSFARCRRFLNPHKPEESSGQTSIISLNERHHTATTLITGSKRCATDMGNRVPSRLNTGSNSRANSAGFSQCHRTISGSTISASATQRQINSAGNANDRDHRVKRLVGSSPVNTSKLSSPTNQQSRSRRVSPHKPLAKKVQQPSFFASRSEASVTNIKAKSSKTSNQKSNSTNEVQDIVRPKSAGKSSYRDQMDSDAFHSASSDMSLGEGTRLHGYDKQSHDSSETRFSAGKYKQASNKMEKLHEIEERNNSSGSSASSFVMSRSPRKMSPFSFDNECIRAPVPDYNEDS